MTRSSNPLLSGTPLLLQLRSDWNHLHVAAKRNEVTVLPYKMALSLEQFCYLICKCSCGNWYVLKINKNRNCEISSRHKFLLMTPNRVHTSCDLTSKVLMGKL